MRHLVNQQFVDSNSVLALFVGASLVTVSATDGDGQAPNNKVFYVMSGGGNDKFKVDSSSGLVSRAGPLDSDTQNQYNLTISAIDGGSPANNDTVVITVTTVSYTHLTLPTRFAV